MAAATGKRHVAEWSIEQFFKLVAYVWTVYRNEPVTSATLVSVCRELALFEHLLARAKSPQRAIGNALDRIRKAPVGGYWIRKAEPSGQRTGPGRWYLEEVVVSDVAVTEAEAGAGYASTGADVDGIIEPPVRIVEVAMVDTEAPVAVPDVPAQLEVDGVPVAVAESPTELPADAGEVPVAVAEVQVPVADVPVAVPEAPVEMTEAPVAGADAPVTVGEVKPTVADEHVVADDVPATGAEAPIAVAAMVPVVTTSPVVVAEPVAQQLTLDFSAAPRPAPLLVKQTTDTASAPNAVSAPRNPDGNASAAFTVGGELGAGRNDVGADLGANRKNAGTGDDKVDGNGDGKLGKAGSASGLKKPAADVPSYPMDYNEITISGDVVHYGRPFAKGAKTEMPTVQSQQERAVRYAAKHGKKIKLFFADTTARGKKTPELARMLVYLKTHPGTAVLVAEESLLWHLDDDYINIGETGAVIHELSTGRVYGSGGDPLAQIHHAMAMANCETHRQNLAAWKPSSGSAATETAPKRKRRSSGKRKPVQVITMVAAASKPAVVLTGTDDDTDDDLDNEDIDGGTDGVDDDGVVE